MARKKIPTWWVWKGWTPVGTPPKLLERRGKHNFWWHHRFPAKETLITQSWISSYDFNRYIKNGIIEVYEEELYSEGGW